MKNYKDVKKHLNKKILSFVMYAILILALASLMLNTMNGTGPDNIFGYTLRLVVSGSMEPEIKVNSLNIIKVCDIEDIEVDDIVCFKYNQDIVHRVIDKKSNESGILILNTKGDANEMPDSIEITSDMIVGKVVKTFNEVAPFIDKYSIEPGIIDTVTLTRNLVIYGLLIGIIIIAVVGIVNNIINLVKSLHKVKDFNVQLDKYIDNIDELILYRDIIKDLMETNVKNRPDTRFEYIGLKIAKAKLLMECIELDHDIKRFKHSTKRCLFIAKLFKSFDGNVLNDSVHDKANLLVSINDNDINEVKNIIGESNTAEENLEITTETKVEQ